MVRTAVAAGLIAVAGAGLAGSAAAASSVARSQVASLGADNASVVTYRNGSKRLVLSNLAPGVELTRVTPGHDRSRISVQQWAAQWKRMYGRAEPNAVLTYGSGAKATRVSWTLASAQYNRRRGQVSFMLRPLAKGGRTRMPLVPTGVHRKKVTTVALGPVTLFID